MFCGNRTIKSAKLCTLPDRKVIENDNLTTVFEDLRISAFSKAFAISPQVKNVTLGPDSLSIEEDEPTTGIESLDSKTVCNDKPSIYSSTPIKNKTTRDRKGSTSHTRKKKNLIDVCGVSPIIAENQNLDNSLSKKKANQLIEIERRLTVDEVMRERIKNMHNADKLIHDSLLHLEKTRIEETNTKRILLEQKIIDDIHKQEIQNKPIREAQLAQAYLQNAQRIQERKQKVKEAEEEAKRKSEAILLKRQQLDKLFAWQKEYGREYQSMLETIKSCKDKAALHDVIAVQTKLLKSCATGWENLIKICKHGDVTAADIEYSDTLVDTIKAIHNCFATEIKKINDAITAEAEQKKEVKPKQPEPNLASQTGTSHDNLTDLSDCFDTQSLQIHLNLRTYLVNYQNTFSDLVNDDSMKKFRFTLQKAVTIPVNAISPVSGTHMADKYIKLHSLLSGQAVLVGEASVSASQHPQGIAFCKNLLAKKFVRQGDLTVSSKPDAAFSIAAVLASLWVDFPDFGQLVLGHFQLECPYLAPVFMPQVEGQSDEAYHKSLGYHYTPTGEVEKQDSFLKRMSGFMRLYAALLISRVRQQGKTNPLGLSEGWRWLSAMLNLQPRPDICATILYDFLEVTGNEMFRIYGGQFKKLLAYICQEYFPRLEKVTPASAGGPIVRLEGFLQKVLKDESVPPPTGAIPPNFW